MRPPRLDLRVLLLGVTATRLDRRGEVEARFAARRPRLIEARQRDAQVVIRRERVAHQRVQRVVAELLPEAGDGSAPGRRCVSVVRFELLGGGNAGFLVVRADGAGREATACRRERPGHA